MIIHAESQCLTPKERCQEEKDHLKFVTQVFYVCADAGLGVSMEHPRGVESWKTRTMPEMDMTYLTDVECDRCQTGLCERGFVQRATDAIYRDMCKKRHENEMLKIFVTDELEVRKEKKKKRLFRKKTKI